MKINYVFILLLILASCQDQVQLNSDELIIQPEHTRAEINDFIYNHIQKGTVFDWEVASSSMIHSATLLSDNLVAIGYTKSGFKDMKDYIGSVDQLPKELLDKRSEILHLILQSEQDHTDASLTLDDIIAYDLDDQIPTLAIQISSKKTIDMLMGMEEIRYVEPMGYDFEESDSGSFKSSSGCDGSPDNINPADYTTTSSYNAKIPWNFGNHNVQGAWNHANGDNISVCIIDTGASDYQDNLGSQFTSGNSGSRFVQRYSTKYSGSWWWKTLDPPHDQCGHGTAMSGLATAPWSTDGNAMGVAYKANLIAVRAVEDVIINTSNEKNGVKDALKLAGNRSDVKVVSMSIGHIFSSGTVKDGIYYAYNRGKLLMAAAGTSTTFTNWAGVIFPASMNETTAVTGVKAQSSYQKCNTCHSGSKVDFTIQMQRSFDSDRNSITLASSTNTPQYISGSSAATATAAGIAALVWSTNTSMSRSSVINRLKVASDIYPSRNSQYGWGNINAQAAVLGQSY